MKIIRTLVEVVCAVCILPTQSNAQNCQPSVFDPMKWTIMQYIPANDPAGFSHWIYENSAGCWSPTIDIYTSNAPMFSSAGIAISLAPVVYSYPGGPILNNTAEGFYAGDNQLITMSGDINKLTCVPAMPAHTGNTVNWFSSIVTCENRTSEFLNILVEKYEIFPYGFPPPTGTPVPPPPPAPTASPVPTPLPKGQDCSVTANSSINIDSLALSENVPLVGMPFSLVYESDRVVGRSDDFQIHIPLLTANIANIKSVSLRVVTAGQEFNQSFSPVANLVYDYTWNGKDFSGKVVAGASVSDITITVTMSDGVSYPTSYSTPIGHFEASSMGLGGWTLSEHHFYDVARKILYFGSGGSRPAEINNYRGSILIPAQDASEAYLFDSNGRHLATLQGLTGASKLAFTYDRNGNLATVTDAFGNRTTIAHNGAGATITSPYGDTTSLTFDANGWLARVVNPAGETYSITTTEVGLLLNFKKPNGIMSAATYDSRGRVVKDMGAGGDLIQLVQKALGQGMTTTAQSAMNRSTSFVTLAIAGGSSRQITSPAGSNSESIVRTLGDSSFQSTDGFISSITKVADARFGALATFPSASSMAIPQSTIATAQYSTQSVILNDSSDPFSVSKMTLNTIVDGTKSVTTIYDGGSHAVTTTSPEGRVRVASYTAAGLLKAVKVGLFDQSTLNYDSRGRLTAIRQASRSSAIEYDDKGRVAQSIDALGNKTRYAYDLAGRLLAQTRPDGQSIAYTYDANGNVTSIQPPQRLAHAFTLNLFELPSRYTPPALASSTPVATQYSYNLDKQLTRIDRPDGKSISFNYAAASGVLNSVVAPVLQIEEAYNSNGQLKTLTSDDGVTIARTYLGPLVASESISGPLSATVSYGYNNDFSLASISVAGSTAIKYETDKDGLVTKAGDETISRDRASGKVIGTTLDSITEGIAYNSVGELTFETYNIDGSQLFSEFVSRDNNGRIIEKSQTQKGYISTSETYKYDSLGRLVEVGRNNSRPTKYSYDTNGNRTSVKGAGEKVLATYDLQDRLVTYGNESYVYNANGELIAKYRGKKLAESYVYDSLGRLKSVLTKEGKRIDYILDGIGRRVVKKVNGKPVRYYVYQSQLQLAAILDSNGKLIERFVYGIKSNIPDEMLTAKGRYRIISDNLGSPRLVVNSVNGHIVAKMRYDEFGNQLTNTMPELLPFGFAGGLIDKDTSIIHFGARDYDPETGRWLSKDPILFNGGDSNLYGYVFNDPVNLTDPNGKCPLCIAIGAGAIAGAIGNGVGTAIAGGNFQQIVNSSINGAIGGAVAGATASGAGIVGVFLGEAISQGLNSLNGITNINNPSDFQNGVNTLNYNTKRTCN